MRRVIITALVLILSAAVLCPAARAVDRGVVEAQLAAAGAKDVEDALPAAASRYLGDMRISADGGAMLEGGIKNILRGGARALDQVFGGILALCARVLAMVILLGVVRLFEGNPALARVCEIAAVLSVTVITLGSVNALIGLGRETMGAISLFSKAALASMTAAAIGAGGGGAAAARQGAAILFSDVLITFCDRLLMPMTTLFVALKTAGAVAGGDMFGRLSGMLRTFYSSVLKAAVTVFGIYISLSGVLAAGADTMAARMTKAAVGGSVPVVGRELSDAMGSVMGGAAIVKDSIGVYALIGIAAIALVPVLEMACHWLLFKLAAALCAPFAGAAVTGVIDGVSDAFGMIFAMVCSGWVLAAVSFVVSIMAAVPGG